MVSLVFGEVTNANRCHDTSLSACEFIESVDAGAHIAKRLTTARAVSVVPTIHLLNRDRLLLVARCSTSRSSRRQHGSALELRPCRSDEREPCVTYRREPRVQFTRRVEVY